MGYDLAVAGHICLDLAPVFNNRQKFEEVFVPGRLSLVGKAALSMGGAVSNTGLAAMKFGLDTVLMSKLGEDYFGRVTREILTATGARVVMSVSQEVSSSYSIVLNPEDADRIFLHHSGANDYFYTSDLDLEIIKEAKVFHFGYPPLMKSFYLNHGRELAKMMSTVKNMGVVTSLDMAMPDPSAESGQVDWVEILQLTGPDIDIFLPSYEELYMMLDKEEYLEQRKAGILSDLSEDVDVDQVRRYARILEGFGMGMIIIKIGKNGIYLRTSEAKRMAELQKIIPAAQWTNHELWAEAYRPDVFISSTGAGDCAVAGFLTALLRGFAPGDCLRLATVAGYQNLRGVDAVSGLGSWPELLVDFWDEEKICNELNLRPEGFRKIGKGLWMAV